MKTMPEDLFDSLVTDPPYGWRFMGKAWDKFDIENRIDLELKRAAPKKYSDGAIRKRAAAQSYVAGMYDRTQTGNHQFQLWTQKWASEALRVLKPGGHAPYLLWA